MPRFCGRRCGTKVTSTLRPAAVRELLVELGQVPVLGDVVGVIALGDLGVQHALLGRAARPRHAGGEVDDDVVGVDRRRAAAAAAAHRCRSPRCSRCRRPAARRGSRRGRTRSGRRPPPPAGRAPGARGRTTAHRPPGRAGGSRPRDRRSSGCAAAPATTSCVVRMGQGAEHEVHARRSPPRRWWSARGRSRWRRCGNTSPMPCPALRSAVSAAMRMRGCVAISRTSSAPV